MDVVTLLLIISDVMHSKKERTQSTMDLVESKAVLYATITKGNNTLDDYLCVFKPQIDTIKAHGGNLAIIWRWHRSIWRHSWYPRGLALQRNTKLW